MNAEAHDVVPAESPRGRAVASLAVRMGAEPNALFLSSLKKVAFKAPNVTTEQLLALAVVANQYQLNPFTKELFAFPDKGGGIVPVVSIDGWSRIINQHSQFDGLEFVEADDGSWVECTIYRKDRQHPTRVREHLAECRRGTDPWKSHPRRMLRHKSMIQAARLAFGFAGIYEQDEAERIVDVTPRAEPARGATQTDRVKAALIQAEPVAEVPAALTEEQAEFVEQLGDE